MLTTFAFFNLDVALLSTVKLIATTDYAHVAGTGRVPNLSFFSTKILLKQKCKNYIKRIGRSDLVHHISYRSRSRAMRGDR